MSSDVRRIVWKKITKNVVVAQSRNLWKPTTRPTALFKENNAFIKNAARYSTTLSPQLISD
jgi:hypothetical protein